MFQVFIWKKQPINAIMYNKIKQYHNMYERDTEDMGEGQGKNYDEKAFNCQINYIIIDKLWHYLGKPPKDLYRQLDITENKYSKIRTGECPLAFMTKLWDRQNNPLQKLGLPKEVMLGDSMIEIKGISRKEWEEYISKRYEGSSNNKDRKNRMRNFDGKLKKAFSDLTDASKPKSNIGKLYYFIKHGAASDDAIDDREMRELQEALKKIRIEHIKNCDDKLCKEIQNKMKDVLYQTDTIIAYKSLK